MTTTTVNRAALRKHLKAGDLERLFEELGWDRLKVPPVVLEVDGAPFTLKPVREKRGFQVFECLLEPGQPMPDRAARMKLERQLAERVYEHLIVFLSADRSRQEWQWVRREPGKPLALRTETFVPGQSGEALVQKLAGLAVSIAEEEELTLPAVTGRASKAFDVERVTKRFFDRFTTEHAAFLKTIEGIEGDEDRKWYASLMLNRLMFVYFIQKKGFLDGDHDYLRRRLERVRSTGKDRFQSFYRAFLLRLFHEGLGATPHDPALVSLIGQVPYLNGGLFEQHRLETDNPDLFIPDAAFEKVFDFFDAYRWHLDERPLRQDDEINPDVLGYIFEKYINQKQMGAYYTKEDITGYIGQNTILPWILDAARTRCKVAFEGEGSVWELLRANPDRYIYPAVKHGLVVDARQKPPVPLDAAYELPEEIAAGIPDVGARGGWNRPAPETHALPTETWREVVARRQRYEELHGKLEGGEVREVADLITLNLDIRQFAQDVVDQQAGPELLRAVWRALQEITILDPTCGSGAFLFAALNILEPLYRSCLDQMERLVTDLAGSDQPHSPAKYKDLRETLARVNEHPNREYFILKAIVVNNLYGVDIMEEATEICKLRLFLKLVAQVERDDSKPNMGLEPLPDVDFNIRAGNSLVGYARYQDVQGVEQSGLDLYDELAQIDERAQDVDRLFQLYRAQQVSLGGLTTPADKEALQTRLHALDVQLDGYLAGEYGVDNRPAKLRTWQERHQPFHWFIEFYGIIKSGGFDVVIGNPPYVELSKIRKEYSIRGYFTEPTGNLYGPVLERSLDLLSPQGKLGMIVPLSLSCTERMTEMRQRLEERAGSIWLSHYSGDANPSILFEGVKSRLDIVLADRATRTGVWSSRYHKWFHDGRPTLFETVTYATVGRDERHLGLVPKHGNDVARSVVRKILARKPIGLSLGSKSQTIYVHRVITMFVKCFDFVPYFWNETDGQKKSDDYKPYTFNRSGDAEVALAVLNSSTFFFYFTAFGDCFHCGKEFVTTFPADLSAMDRSQKANLANLGRRLMADLKHNAIRKSAYSNATGQVEYDEFWPRYSKHIVDDIDRVLGQHYDFNDYELDFVLNYDLKFRMGRGSAGAD